MKNLSIAALAIFFAISLSAQTVQYNSNKGIAIKGYDPVAYFIEHKAVEGNKQFSTEWSGSQWKFISQSNLDSFKLTPEKYAPQFGGYCAMGVSENHKAPTDPTAWTIVNDKLYLNYNASVKEMWLKDTVNRINTANTNWQSLNK